MTALRPYRISRHGDVVATRDSTSSGAALADYAADLRYDGRVDRLSGGRSTLSVLGVGVFQAELDVPIVLSSRQHEVASLLCLLGGSAEAALVARGATRSSLESLVRIGVVVVRRAGGFDPLYHLTKAGRELVCTHDPDADPGADHPEIGGSPMTTATKDLAAPTKPDTKKKDPRRATPRGRKAAPSANPSPIVDVDVTTPAAPIDVAALSEALIAALVEKVGDLGRVEKQAYVRLMHEGSVVAYVRRSKKGLLVTVEARVADPADVAAAADVVAGAFALS